MATAKDQIKESLVGTVLEPSLSTDAQATFERHAKKDESNGELYMTEEEFVNAIAPSNEDYVGSWSSDTSGVSFCKAGAGPLGMDMLTLYSCIA